MFIKSKMIANPFTISPDQSIPEAQEIMFENSIKHLPVVKNDKVVGIISKGDIERYSPTKATTFSVGEITYLLSKTKISSIMRKEFFSISSTALLEEAAILMRDSEISFLPVIDDGKLVGIITKGDILDSYIDLLGFREYGTRFTIEAVDEPGTMTKITSVMGNFGTNITNIAVYRGTAGKSNIVIGINSLNTNEIEKAIEEQGFKIIYKLQNK